MREELIDSLKIAKCLLQNEHALDQNLQTEEEQYFETKIIDVVKKILKILLKSSLKDLLKNQDEKDIFDRLDSAIGKIEKVSEEKINKIITDQRSTFEELFGDLHGFASDIYASNNQLKEEEKQLAEVRFNKGKLLLMLGKKQKALEQFEIAWKINSSDEITAAYQNLSAEVTLENMDK